ncbi:unnamed protein product (macronuclear) [Paramecium tetraurelia]|uniref:C2H2-type domain-containing protein n=1 Tax=Paramecium tetraurelia TaxID=5888 RepID=A0E6H2_PARTE|nr:uncharacterized protein GSPATT00003754001 [Paramecium tetraurelia]CAK90889.1 unnamed protein product [Paramecium tetraurelia]|eukprot:XP_001458286.1 hypothetical protein (macronuclear) [Paramecium tetraurelia strain d4-2]
MKQQYPVPNVTKKVIIINQKSNVIHENDNRCNTQNQQQTNSDQQKQIKKIEIPIELDANNYNEQSCQQITRMYQKNSIQLQDFQAQIDELKERIQFIEQKFSNLETNSRKKKKRRTAAEIEKNFECPYKNCLKQYGSDVSLNLHIKFKHNGGNKSERQKIIVNTILQQKKQLQAGEIDEKDIRDINLPPI